MSIDRVEIELEYAHRALTFILNELEPDFTTKCKVESALANVASARGTNAADKLESGDFQLVETPR